MTKGEILHTFKEINAAYNNCMMYSTLERMLDELCEDMMPKTEVLALLDRIDNDVYEGLGYDHEKWVEEVKNASSD